MATAGYGDTGDPVGPLFRFETYCDPVDANGAAVCAEEQAVDTILEECRLVVTYEERIGLHDQMVAKQFDGFQASRYIRDRWLTPAAVYDRWTAITDDSDVETVDCELWQTSDQLFCTITATVAPRHEYGIEQDDVTIRALLDPDSTVYDTVE